MVAFFVFRIYPNLYGASSAQDEEIEGKMRAIFSGLEERLARKLDARERIVAFIPDYAAYLFNRLAKGENGKLEFERVKGNKPKILGLESVEQDMYKK